MQITITLTGPFDTGASKFLAALAAASAAAETGELPVHTEASVAPAVLEPVKRPSPALAKVPPLMTDEEIDEATDEIEAEIEAEKAVPPPKKKGPGRPRKVEVVEELEAETEEEEAAAAEAEEAEEELDLVPPPKKKVAGIDVDTDLIPAFKAYAAEHGRDEAVKVLAKYKVKTVREIPAAKYAEVLKKLQG